MNTELTKEKLRNIYGKVSPFEFKDKLLKLAKLNNNTILDAGRGNPNWTAATLDKHSLHLDNLLYLKHNH